MEDSEVGSKLTSFLGRLMGPRDAGAAPQENQEAVEYKGYAIRPACRREGSQWITAGVIAKEFDDGIKEQPFIRADFYSTKDDADACSITKAKRIIDEQGDKLFDKS
jgi:hypothetical protein